MLYTLISIYNKVFEKLMKKFLIDYLTSKSILHSSQFGFRKGLSTFDALNSITSDIFTALDNHKSALCIFVDFQKAFDTVPHKLLLKKLEFYGIRGRVLDWFENYLSDRTQNTTYNGSSSISLPITYGVPQGSILGPILFLIFINDISHVFSDLKVVLFADDSSFYIIGNDINQLFVRANAELDKFHEWTLCNQLSIHLNKTKYILFSNKRINHHFPLFLDFEVLKECEYHKVLGVTLDSKLSFKFHINDVCSKLSRSISLLQNLKDYMPLEVLKTVYYAHVHPHLSYCLPLWGSTYPTHLQTIFVLQKRALRIITKSSFLEHTHPLFKSARILKFFDQVKLEIGSFMFKNNANPMFERLMHNYNTRFRNRLIPPLHELSLLERCIKYNGPKIWNSIPDSIQNKANIRIFRATYKKYILSQY